MVLSEGGRRKKSSLINAVFLFYSYYLHISNPSSFQKGPKSLPLTFQSHPTHAVVFTKALDRWTMEPCAGAGRMPGQSFSFPTTEYKTSREIWRLSWRVEISRVVGLHMARYISCCCLACQKNPKPKHETLEYIYHSLCKQTVFLLWDNHLPQRRKVPLLIRISSVNAYVTIETSIIPEVE